MSLFQVPLGPDFESEGWKDMVQNANRENEREIERIAQHYAIPNLVAGDIWYLRGRSRGTAALEQAIVRCSREKGVENFEASVGNEDLILRTFGYWTPELQTERSRIERRLRSSLRWKSLWWKLQAKIKASLWKTQ